MATQVFRLSRSRRPEDGSRPGPGLPSHPRRRTAYGCGMVPGHAPAAVRAVAFSPDGARLISGGADGTVKAWSLGAPRDPPAVFRSSDSVLAVATDPAGTTIASGGSDQSVRFWKPGDPAARP